jgi:agmatinase
MAFDPNAAAQTDELFGLVSLPADAAVHVIPVPYDGTVSYASGTAQGPEAVRVASHQVDLTDQHFGPVWTAGLATLDPVAPPPSLKPDRAGEWIRSALRERVGRVLAAGKIPCVLGGEHSVSLGAIEACSAGLPSLGLLQIDAHMDLRRAYEGNRYSHASVILNAAEACPNLTRIVQVGIRDFCEDELSYARDSGGRIAAVFDADVWAHTDGGGSLRSLFADAVASLPERVYVTLDIDGLDPALCPHTGTPVPGGLSFNAASALLVALAESGRRIVGFDLVEVAPGPDGDEWDGNVGARILYKLAGCALRSQGRLRAT